MSVTRSKDTKHPIFNSLTVNGVTTFNGATITLAQDTNFVLSGGINGASFGTDFLSLDGTNNRVGIGTAAPFVQLHIKRTAAALLILESGTAAFRFHASSNGSCYIEAGGIGGGSADINFTAFFGVNIWMTIKSVNGKVGIGTNLPTGHLDVVQGTTDAAIPVLDLEQLDIDDSFINFIGTAASDGSRSISTDTTEDSAKYGAFRVEANGTTKWVRMYDDES